MFPICVVKHSEDAALIQYKGRVVFQGNNVRDEFGLHALFPDQCSGASFMTASRCMDAISLLRGCAGQQPDAPQAYVQAPLGTGPGGETQKTYVEIPRDQWPKHWIGKYKDPVCPLVLALYGHPLSGTYWENYYTKNFFW